MAFHDFKNSTIHCEGCEWLVQPHGSNIGSHCVKCSKLLADTQSNMLFRAKDRQDIDLECCELGSHTNYRYLSTSEKCIHPVPAPAESGTSATSGSFQGMSLMINFVTQKMGGRSSTCTIPQ